MLFWQIKRSLITNAKLDSEIRKLVKYQAIIEIEIGFDGSNILIINIEFNPILFGDLRV